MRGVRGPLRARRPVGLYGGWRHPEGVRATDRNLAKCPSPNAGNEAVADFLDIVLVAR